MKGSRHLVAVAGALALAASLTAGLATSSAADTDEEGTLGGPLHAEMYPSGLDTAPDGTVVIADTGNNRVAKYNANGALIWETGTHGTGTNQFDNPRDVGVDPAGNIYVADTRNSRIVKLSSTGAWLGSTTGPSTAFSFPLGVSAKGNKVYVGDTGRHRVVVLDQSLAVTQTVTANGVCANINDNRDAQADAAGNIYVAGYKTNEIVKFAANGTCISKWGGTGTTPGKFRTPYGIDTGIDPVTGQELVYVADGLNNRMQAFTTAGVFVTEFGSFGEPDQVGTFTTMRRVALDKTGTGHVWSADLWGNRIERWDRTSTGFTYNRTNGDVMPEPTGTAVFHEPRGMAFTPSGDLWVADTVHHSFQRFNGNGNLISTCGQRAAEGTQLGQYNWPRGIAVDPQTGNLWIADTKQHQLQVMTPNCEGIGFVSNAAPAPTSAPSTGPTTSRSGRVTARRSSSTPRTTGSRPTTSPTPTWPSRQQGPAAGVRVRHARHRRQQLPAGPAPSRSGPNGNVYVADRGNNRIQEYTLQPDERLRVRRTWTRTAA